MKLEDFVHSLTNEDPPGSIDHILLALWYDAKNQWSKAHEIVQDMEGTHPAWIHAYLHRKEGDEWNAGYWYRRAGKDPCKLSLAEEWKNLVEYFLTEV